MFFAAGRIRPIVLTAAFLVFGSFGHAHALVEQQERNWNHDAIVVAQAETPSNTCARERTECLRARVQKGILGSEYVPPDDTARCQAAYRTCLSGQQQQSVQPAPRGPATSSTGNVLAGARKIELFGLIKCDITGNEVICRDEHIDEARIVRTLTGTISANRIDGTVAHDVTAGFRNPCQTIAKGIEKRSYTFTADGMVKMESGPISWTKTTTCSSYRSRDTSPGGSAVGKWRVLE